MFHTQLRRELGGQVLSGQPRKALQAPQIRGFVRAKGGGQAAGAQHGFSILVGSHKKPHEEDRDEDHGEVEKQLSGGSLHLRWVWTGGDDWLTSEPKGTAELLPADRKCRENTENTG